MKKRINLLSQKKDYIRREKFFLYVRRATLVLGCLAFAGAMSLLVLLLSLRREYSTNLREKETILSSLLPAKDLESKVAFLQTKGTTLSKIAQKDLNFSPYYQLLNNTLLFDVGTVLTATPTAFVDAFSMDNEREFALSLALTGDERLFSFLQRLNNEEFLTQFDELQIDHVSITNPVSRTYEVSLVGIFTEKDYEAF